MTCLGASKFILPLALILLAQCPKAESAKLGPLLESILGVLQNIEKLLKDDTISVSKNPASSPPKLPSIGRRSAQPDNNDANKDPASQDNLPMNVLLGSSHKRPKSGVTAKLNKNMTKTKKQPKLRSRIEHAEGIVDLSPSSSKNRGNENGENPKIEQRLFVEDEETS